MHSNVTKQFSFHYRNNSWTDTDGLCIYCEHLKLWCVTVWQIARYIDWAWNRLTLVSVRHTSKLYKRIIVWNMSGIIGSSVISVAQHLFILQYQALFTISIDRIICSFLWLFSVGLFLFKNVNRKNTPIHSISSTNDTNNNHFFHFSLQYRIKCT